MDYYCLIIDPTRGIEDLIIHYINFIHSLFVYLFSFTQIRPTRMYVAQEGLGRSSEEFLVWIRLLNEDKLDQ